MSTMNSPLQGAEPVAFVATTDAARARAFYQGTLGLPVLSEDPFALVLQGGATTLRVTKVQEIIVAPYTVLGWRVASASDTVRALSEQGVSLLRYDFLEQDDLGIWTSPSGAKIAWFHDPDKNVLSISEY